MTSGKSQNFSMCFRFLGENRQVVIKDGPRPRVKVHRIELIICMREAIYCISISVEGISGILSFKGSKVECNTENTAKVKYPWICPSGALRGNTRESASYHLSP